MKKVFAVLAMLGIVAAVYAVDWRKDYSSKTVTLTSSTTGDSSRVVDTIKLSPNGPLFPYRGYIVKVKIGPNATTSAGSHATCFGAVDTCTIVIKRRDGLRAPLLIDSTKFAARALKTVACSTLVQMHPIDSIWAEDMFAVLIIADTTSDTAGAKLYIPVTGELLLKN